MNTKEKAHPAGSAARRADMGNAVTGNNPLSDCTTPSQPPQASVFTGSHRARKMRLGQRIWPGNVDIRAQGICNTQSPLSGRPGR